MTIPAPMSLYQNLLREHWNAVSPRVKNSHLSGKELHANCCLDVVGSSNVVGKIIGRIISLPVPGKAAPVTLHIHECPEGELWERMFPDCNLRSVQSQSAEGYLVDRFGVIAFCFHLEVSNGGIINQHRKTYLRFGVLSLRLPWFVSPRVVSHEEPDDKESASRITVSLSMPLVGHLLSYNGIVRPIKERA